MNNFVEEDMEEYDKHITVTEADASEDCKLLLFTGYDHEDETNSQNNLFQNSYNYESRMMVKEYEQKPQQQNTVNNDLEDDFKVEPHGQMRKIKKYTVSTATKNTNLFTRQTETNSSNVKPFFISKPNTSSNSLVKPNQIKILSTSTVTMPKSTTTHLQQKLSINTELDYNKSVLRINQFNKIVRTVVLNKASKDEKCIPHTVTSKDLMEINSNTFVQNSEVKINTNYSQKLNASSNSKLLKQSSDSLLRYGQEKWTGEIIKNDNAKLQLMPLSTSTKSKSQLHSCKMVKNGTNGSKGSKGDIIEVNYNETHTSQNLNTKRTAEKHLNNNKVSLSDKIVNSNYQSKSYGQCKKYMDNKPIQFVSCKYQYCDTIMHESELIDNLYCSLTCKHLDIEKQIVTKEENSINKPTHFSKNSTVHLKHHSKKLEKRISKRKQLVTAYNCSKDMVKVNDNWDRKITNVFDKPSKQKNQSPLKPLLPIISPGSINYDDEYFDLKPLIKDKDVLEYMIQFQTKSAPKKLFDRPFPTENNCFEVGQKLEGIDPKHEALFCVMTVSEVCGYRIKLHFDGYQDDYDFWVNADCPDLFYPGWCKKNSRVLQPPKDYENKFDWIVYLKECQALPAPKHNFVSTRNLNGYEVQHKFHIGGKLEALDKSTRVLQRQFICVATVVDILGNRIRIHLDGWTDDLDYWTDILSTNIHPIRWCDNNGKMLTPPKGFRVKDKTKTFNWTEYLKITNSKPVPKDAFVRQPLRDFSKNMIIEVVDLVVPRLLRIAMVVDMRNNELKIIYDGFQKEYEYWIEDDSPDIHPVGWSSKTNHPIQLPPALLWRCSIPGCRGFGNSSNRLKNYHNDLKGCPYEIDSWKTNIVGLTQMNDRLKMNNILITSTLARSKTKSNVHHDENKKTNIINTEHNMNLDKIKEKIDEERLNFSLNNNILSMGRKKLCKNIGISTVGFNLNSISMDPLCRYWTKYNAELGMRLSNATNVRLWSIHEVASFVQKVVKFYNSDSNAYQDTNNISDIFIDQAIDGEAFLMLNQDDLMEILKIPLGYALKIYHAIIMIRQQTDELFEI